MNEDGLVLPCSVGRIYALAGGEERSKFLTWVVILQAKDVAGNNRSDGGDLWALQCNSTGRDAVSLLLPMQSVGPGLYGASYELTDVGDGAASVAVVLRTPEVRVPHNALIHSVSCLLGSMGKQQSSTPLFIHALGWCKTAPSTLHVRPPAKLC